MSAHGLGVDVESRRIRYVASGIVRHNGDVIAYLLIIGKASLRIERIACRNIGRPRRATVGAK